MDSRFNVGGRPGADPLRDRFGRRDEPRERDGNERGGRGRSSEPKEDSPARMTVQFREAANMTYELDCAGNALVLRVFFPTESGQWRILAQAGSAADAPSSDSTAPSRLEALRNIASASRDGNLAPALGRIDWNAVEQAMTKVRAV
jgi:hypothetical protein